MESRVSLVFDLAPRVIARSGSASVEISFAHAEMSRTVLAEPQIRAALAQMLPDLSKRHTVEWAEVHAALTRRGVRVGH